METKEMELQDLEDSLFEKDDSARVNADKMSRPSLTYIPPVPANNYIFYPDFSCASARK